MAQVLQQIYQLANSSGGTALRYLIECIALGVIFRRCGAVPIKAFIPGLRFYETGRIADREDDGRIGMLLEIALYVTIAILWIGLQFGLLKEEDPTYTAIAILMMVLAVIYYVYSIRVDLGLCRMFGRSRMWIVLWTIMPALTAVIWALDKNCRPQQCLDGSRDATPLTEQDLPPLEHGLTVNIKERTVIESFKRKYLLRDIHLDIEPGNMVLLLGGSGAGKTTFVNAVTGYEKAEASITLDKEDVYRSFERMKYQVGLVPQQDLVRGADTIEMTLRDSARMRLPSTCSAKEREERIDRVLAEFGLTHARKHLISKLSGGQRKRLSIALEYIAEPTLFILDEPDSGLDGVIARDLMEQLHRISREGDGKIVMVITHTPDRVIDQFDKVIVLAKDANRVGRLAFYGSADEARSFFDKESMEDIVLTINSKEAGGEGRADEFISKYNAMMAANA